MYIRRTTYRLKPEFSNEDGEATFQRKLRENIHPLQGLISSTHIPNDDGSWSIVVVWLDEDAATLDANVKKIDDAWSALDSMLAGPRQVEAAGVTIWDQV